MTNKTANVATSTSRASTRAGRRLAAGAMAAALMIPLAASAAGASTSTVDSAESPRQFRSAEVIDELGLPPSIYLALGFVYRKCLNAMYPGDCDGPVR